MTVEVIDTAMSDQNHAKENNPTQLSSSRPPVKRSLFGAVNHEECLNFLKKETDSMSKAASQRWNFDFEASKPLEPSNGSFKWIQVKPDELIPHAYSMSRLERSFREYQLTESRQDSVPETKVTEPSQPKFKQKTINDYFTSRKRTSDKRNQSHHEKLSDCHPPNKRPRQNECV